MGQHRERLKQVDTRSIVESLVKLYPEITIDRSKFDGMPYIRGTEITVPEVMWKFAENEDAQSLVDAYKGTLSNEQILDALRYASDLMRIGIIGE